MDTLKLVMAGIGMLTLCLLALYGLDTIGITSPKIEACREYGWCFFM